MKALLLVFAAFATVTITTAAGIIQSGLKLAIDRGETNEAILELPQMIDNVLAAQRFQSLSGDFKVAALVSALQFETQIDQAPYVTNATKELGLTTEQLWASNIILVKGLNSKSLAKLASTSPGNFTLRLQRTVKMSPVHIDRMALVSNKTQSSPQWGVAKIRAPEAWKVTKGEGVVVGIIDTGVNLRHPALSGGYANSWMDPYYSTPEPTDVAGHGSHCTGSILGRANGVGVAPEAQWIACRGLNHQGRGTEAALTQCAQFMLTANPRPHIISNSWGGHQGETWFNPQIRAWKEAGIIPVFAIGNDGDDGCGSANSPGDQDGVISVGATTSHDEMAYFSSRGPSTTGLLKPEVSAPGQAIVSCGTGESNYVTMSGTSMAAPHTAGAIALILAKTPGMSTEQVLELLSTTAAQPPLTSGDRVCGLPGDGDFPNNAFGAGRIDVGRALGV